VSRLSIDQGDLTIPKSTCQQVRFFYARRSKKSKLVFGALFGAISNARRSKECVLKVGKAFGPFFLQLLEKPSENFDKKTASPCTSLL
jgi:hypothetical protein|tara:strand:- start:4592 stop:4855 length:264 start_codon:yes stop_codon:yes gene_type:complete